MKTLNIADVRDRFSSLVDEVHSSGEGIAVAKYGHPLVMLVPFKADTSKPSAYPLRGLPYRMADDFDEPLSQLAEEVAESGPSFGSAEKSQKGK